jgi:precorrin-6B methylase 2/cytochrome c553
MRIVGAVLLSAVTAGAQSPPTPAVGSVAAGKTLFEGAGACATCHSIEATGRRPGPNLSWIGMLRTQESLRRALTAHRSTPSLSAADIDHVVAYLRTLRSIPPSDPRERTRAIPTASENVAFFDRPERDAEERSDALVEALEIPEGSTIADIGAGTGYFTWRLARRAGPTGRVIAVDIQQRMLDLAAETVRQHGLVNVDYVLGRETDPRLPPSSLDFAFIAHSFHEFSQPETIMEAIRRSLKPAGRLVIVEYAKENHLAPAAPLHKMSFNEIREEIEPMGFELERILDFLPVQHGLIFSVR